MIPNTQYIPEESIKKVWPERFEETKDQRTKTINDKAAEGKNYAQMQQTDLLKYSTSKNIERRI